VKCHEVPEHAFGALPAPVFAIVVAQASHGMVLVLNRVQVPAAFSSSETLAVDLWRGERPGPVGQSDEWLLRKFAGT
jgi:hypothetical protein